MEIQVILVVPSQSAAQVALDIAASFLHTFLDRVGHLAVVGPTEIVAPLEQPACGSVNWRDQRNKIARVAVLE